MKEKLSQLPMIYSDVEKQKEYLANEAISYLPKIIELLDRNPFSETYGCFDRAYWHYRTADFPSGMYQEYVLPLALVYQFSFPNNPYYQQSKIKDWVIAGIKFAMKSSHPDASCDDYYPFEKALGAAAFALYAATEAYLVLDLDDEEIEAFFTRRADWLMKHDETGRLSNHHALVALCLQNVYLITKDNRFIEGAQNKVKELLSWQTDEGWFPEYEGCDPGYLSICVDFLSKYYQKTKDSSLIEPLKKAVNFMTYFSHPDGSYGGEYGSRNTYHFFPHGLEILGAEISEALILSSRSVSGAIQGKRAYTDDDRIFGHLVYNYMQAYLDFKDVRPENKEIISGDYYFEKSGLFIKKTDETYLVINVKKGGVFKYFVDKELVCSDTGLILETKSDKVLVSHMMNTSEAKIEEGQIVVKGTFCVRSHILLKTKKFVLFRLFMLTVGRFSRDLVRWLLQRKIIYQKEKGGVDFIRTFSFGNGLKVKDELRLVSSEVELDKISTSSDATSIYVATSQPFQASGLLPWRLYEDEVKEINQTKKVGLVRNWS